MFHIHCKDVIFVDLAINIIVLGKNIFQVDEEKLKFHIKKIWEHYRKNIKNKTLYITEEKKMRVLLRVEQLLPDGEVVENGAAVRNNQENNIQVSIRLVNKVECDKILHIF